MRKFIIALFALLLAAPATAQQFPTVHDHTVIGRIGTGSGSGPSQEIPFATLFANLISASGVPNAVLVTDGSGNGTFSTTLPSGLIIPSPNLTGSIKSPFGANLPIFGGGNGVALQAGTATGNTTKVATANGAFTASNCLTTDVNHNIVDNGVPCGTGSNTSSTQDFLAGTNFTAGTTTSLTVSSTPISAANAVVTFDGIVQSHNTWTLVGSVFTFSAAIPLNTQVVEISWLSTAVLPTFVTSFGGANGALLAGTGLTVNGQTVNVNMGSVDNLLQNNQWRLWCCVAFSTKQNAAGTANQTNVSCTAFTISTQDPVFTCANTQTLRVGDIAIVSNIVSFWGFAGGGFITCGQVQCNGGYVTAARVTSVVANTSVTLHSPFGSGISPAASVAATIIPIVPLASGSTGPDGWTKTATLIASVDDWGAAATPASTIYPGCERPLLLRKGITGNELFSFDVAPSLLPLWQGQTVTFGVAIYQRIQGGGSTGNTYVQDSAGTTFSTALTGSGFGGYQFITVTRTISQTASSVQIGFQSNGNSGDVFDVCLPTAAFVPSMSQSQLHTNSYEKTVAFSHWNPPLLTPDIVNFPTVALGGAAPTLYGYNTNDLEAMSFGEVHNTVGHVWSKLEWKTATSWLGCNVFMGGFINTGNGALTFGLQAAGQVNNIVFPTSMSPIPLYHVGGTFSLYTDCNNAGGVVPTAGTWDFTDIDNNGPTSQQ